MCNIRKRVMNIYRFSILPGLSIDKYIEILEFKDENGEWKPIPEIYSHHSI